MKIKHHIIALALVGTTTIIGMEQPANGLKIDFSNPEKACKILTKNKAAELQRLVAMEQRGHYCPVLAQAEAALRKIIIFPRGDCYNIEIKCNDEDEDYFASLCVNDKVFNFVGFITKKSNETDYLLDRINNYKKHPKEEEGSINYCRGLLQKNRYIANAYGSYEPYQDRIITPLHHVLAQIAHGFLPKKTGEKFCEMLLSCGANVNAHDDVGNTPLHHASSPGLIALLCSYGANPSQTGELERTPLLSHACWQNWLIVERLLRYSSAEDINKQDQEGCSLLEKAIRSGNRDIVQLLLLDKGADWTLCNDLANILYDETIDLIVKIFMINHIEESIKKFVQTEDYKAIKRINGYFFDLINSDNLERWIMDNFWDSTKLVVACVPESDHFWDNLEACVTNHAAKRLLKRLIERKRRIIDQILYTR